MKLSISLSAQDVAKIDRYVDAVGLPSRSAAIQRAVRLLDDEALEDDYAAAWDEWRASPDAEQWDRTAGDGLA